MDAELVAQPLEVASALADEVRNVCLLYLQLGRLFASLFYRSILSSI